MDHIPLPKDLIDLPIDVPLLSLKPYDGKDFNGYPEHAGWSSRTNAEWQALFRSPPPKFVAFLQRWTYFGFLSRILDTEIDMHDFVRPGTKSRPMLSTRKLPHYLQAWQVRTGKYGFQDGSDTLLTLEGAFLTHRGLIESPEAFQDEDVDQTATLPNFIQSGFRGDPRGQEFAFATSLMMEAVVYVMDRTRSASFNTCFQWTSLPWLRLRKAGWCPSQLAPMFDQFSSAGVLYMTYLRRPKVHEDHRMIRVRPGQGSMPLKLCNEFECSFRKINNNTYVTAHADGCTQADCDIKAVKREELFRILDRGMIPLITTAAPTKENTEIPLVERESQETDYVAISHVWSDGLGNLEDNAMPQCQLNRLISLVQNLPGRARPIEHFWLDTICVPPDSKDKAQQKAQVQALNLMRDTYADATAVLVLDSWLLSNTCSDKEVEEVLMRIFNSTWNSRLWTYQEGALAKSLCFQFKDAAYDLEDGMAELHARSEVNFALSFTLTSSLNVRYENLRQFMRKTTAEERMLAVFEGLRFRSTSVLADEALCLATLLGLDVSKILKAGSKASQRMKRFWKLVEKVPLEVLGFEGETFDLPGLRWAPRSFLHVESSRTHRTGAYLGFSGKMPLTELKCGIRTPQGLRIRSQGYTFQTGENRLSNEILMRDQESHWSYLVGTGIHSWGVRNDAFDIDPAAELGVTRLAFLSLWSEDRENVPPHMVPGDTGILVAILDKPEGDDGVIYVRRLSSAIRMKAIPELHRHNLSLLESRLGKAQDYISSLEGLAPNADNPSVLYGLENDLLVSCMWFRMDVEKEWCIE